MLGLLVLAVGLALGALAAAVHETWLLVPCSLVLGSAYGLCLVAGLLEVQRLAPERALGVLTAGYYAVTYTGFAAPYLMTLASDATSYALLLLIASGLAVLTAGVVRHGAQPERERRAQAVRGLIG
jgi:MFS family permease